MPLKWKIYRVIFIIQMLASSIFDISSLIIFSQRPGIGEFLRILLFLFIFLLTVMSVNLINNNYPDVPITGKQKSNFNRLFLVNFLFLGLLFGIIFSEIRQINALTELISENFFSLPLTIYIPLISLVAILLLQFIILFGLYELRRELYRNFRNKEFEFEDRRS